MIFPFTWRAGLVEILYHLSRMGYGYIQGLIVRGRSWTQKLIKMSLYLEWTPTQSPWKVGNRGSANKWMTFYALLAIKAARRVS